MKYEKKDHSKKMYDMKTEKESFLCLGVNVNMKREFQISSFKFQKI